MLFQYIRRYPPYLEAVSSIRNAKTCNAVLTGAYINVAENEYSGVGKYLAE
jgi:hypothetical protein